MQKSTFSWRGSQSLAPSPSAGILVPGASPHTSLPGSRGVFCQVSATDQQQLSFYSKLGFVALPVAWDSCPGARLLGRLL